MQIILVNYVMCFWLQSVFCKTCWSVPKVQNYISYDVKVKKFISLVQPYSTSVAGFSFLWKSRRNFLWQYVLFYDHSKFCVVIFEISRVNDER